jgi:predicted ATPase
LRIELTLKNYRCFPDSSPARIVIEDGKWTAFVGVNNSGKSSLLRFFYEFRPWLNEMANPNHWLDLARGTQGGVPLSGSIRDAQEVFNKHNDRPMLCEFSVTNAHSSTIPKTLPLHKVTFRILRTPHLRVELAGLTTEPIQPFPLSGNPELTDNTVLRSDHFRVDIGPYMEAMLLVADTFYVGAFRNLLNTGAKVDYFDIKVGDAFIKQWREMQTGNSLQQNAACEDVTAAVERLFGYERLTMQAAQTDDTLQLVIDRKPYKLHEVGAGIAQFIMVLANVAIRRPGFLLIDEPELNLHPSLQLDFLSAVGGFAKHGVLFATHSIGLARASADRIFAVRRRAQGVSEVSEWESTRNLPELVGSLSYSGYQAVGFDTVLLVEGPTEVRTVQQFLRKLRKDHQVLLVPLGGSSFITSDRAHELDELRRITTNVHALIDSERVAAGAALAKDREAFRQTCQSLKMPCHVLEHRALENYLSDAAIKQVKGEKYRALTPFEELKKTEYAWGKHENWRIASEMKWEDIENTDLGRFLQAL